MRILILSLLFIIQGCVSTDVVPQGPVFNYSSPNNKDDVTAYFYQDSMPGVTSCLLVGIAGEYKGCIGYPGFAKVVLQPGTHEVSFTPNAAIKIANLDFVFEFKLGTEYFFKYQLVTSKSASDKAIESQHNMLLGATFGWYLVEKKQALTELQDLKAWHKTI
ncbi:hypothetical protein [Thalassotalea maritima]|uniref:hypothetical protein n=1 Tax=Thalassotalea maritima TaxID=3242416 RepID=UPI0035283A1D